MRKPANPDSPVGYGGTLSDEIGLRMTGVYTFACEIVPHPVDWIGRVEQLL